jgi:hypothetical protein
MRVCRWQLPDGNAGRNGSSHQPHQGFVSTIRTCVARVKAVPSVGLFLWSGNAFAHRPILSGMTVRLLLSALVFSKKLSMK